ncbi:MAG: hypothetical protein JWP91_2691 [Fibrobacteres bacterium]|nr:hypothetical protein [Fibrobacterota bacterium]
MRANKIGRTTGSGGSSLRYGAALAMLSALAFAGCVNDDRSAGVDEFPNSIYARVNGFLDEGKKSESISPAAGISDSLLGTGFHVAAGKVAGRKIAAASEAGAESAAMFGLAKSAAADSGCVSGSWTVTDSVPSPFKYTINTLTVCLDAKALDSIKGNETVIRGKSVTTFNTGRIESAEFTDADGDGILNPLAGKASKANLAFSTLEKGVSEKTLLVVGPGPDNSFDTENDNLVYSASWVKTSGDDTLASAAYADADSDGVAIDNGKASVVDLDFYQKGPSEDHPDAVWSRAQMRLVVRYKVEAKEARRVRFEMLSTAGRHETGEVLNAQGGRDFDMRDTVEGRFVSVGTAAADSVDAVDVRLTMTLGSDFDAKGDDRVYAMDVKSRKKIGEEKSARFTFASDKPIPSGKDPEAGTLTMRLEYGDGSSLTVEGTVSPAMLDVIVKDRTGKRQHAVWDREGRGISLVELP